MNETYAKLGMKPADILLPRDADMSKWAVVACDQFTSQPEYWEEADRIVGDAPSTENINYFVFDCCSIFPIFGLCWYS